ncbi:hypothetical protein D3C81_900190 [compost metagenome]
MCSDTPQNASLRSLGAVADQPSSLSLLACLRPSPACGRGAGGEGRSLHEVTTVNSLGLGADGPSSAIVISPCPANQLEPARSAAVGVPTTPPAAGATPSSGLVQTPHQSRATVAHHGVRQSCPATKPSPVRNPPPTTIRVAARRAVNALLVTFAARAKVTRPFRGETGAYQIATRCPAAAQNKKKPHRTCSTTSSQGVPMLVSGACPTASPGWPPAGKI